MSILKSCVRFEGRTTLEPNSPLLFGLRCRSPHVPHQRPPERAGPFPCMDGDVRVSASLFEDLKGKFHAVLATTVSRHS